MIGNEYDVRMTQKIDMVQKISTIGNTGKGPVAWANWVEIWFEIITVQK